MCAFGGKKEETQCLRVWSSGNLLTGTPFSPGLPGFPVGPGIPGDPGAPCTEIASTSIHSIEIDTFYSRLFFSIALNATQSQERSRMPRQ